MDAVNETGVVILLCHDKLVTMAKNIKLLNSIN